MATFLDRGPPDASRFSLKRHALQIAGVAFLAALACIAPSRAELPGPIPAPGQTPVPDPALPRPPLVAYQDSWSEHPATGAAATLLAATPGYINIVALAFLRPDLTYRGNLDLENTGFDFPYPGTILRDAIRLLKTRHPATRVIVSIGGATYANWRQLNEAAIAALVHDLGADGVDLDFIPKNPGCTPGPDGQIGCATDAAWRDFVTRFRRVLPRPFLLTIPVWSTGAYGEGAYRGSQPRGRYTGFMLPLLRSPEAADIDLLSLCAYDAGPRFDPMEGFRAYRSVWKGPLALGTEVPIAGATGPFHTTAATESLAHEIARDPMGGMMIYPLLGGPDGVITPDHPDGPMLAAAACRGLGLPDCGVP